MNKEHNDESTVRVYASGNSIPEREGLFQHPFVTSGLELERNILSHICAHSLYVND